MRHLLFFIGRLFSFFCPLKLCLGLRMMHSWLYTGYYAPFFMNFGHDSILVPRVWSLRGMQHISIGNNVTLGGGIQLTAWSDDNQKVCISIGDGCALGSHNHITAIHSITIGNNVLTGKNVTITDNSHGSSSFEEMSIDPKLRELSSKGAVEIGDNVWIGDKVTILPGVHIGYGAIIGANSVVVNDVPSYCVAAGIPAKVLKKSSIVD